VGTPMQCERQHCRQKVDSSCRIKAVRTPPGRGPGQAWELGHGEETGLAATPTKPVSHPATVERPGHSCSVGIGQGAGVPPRCFLLPREGAEAGSSQILLCVRRRDCYPPRLSGSGTSLLRRTIRRRTVGCALAAVGAVADAVGAGDITPDEGQAVASILEAKRKAIETVDLEARLSALEQEHK
jgi:hypothetical protein